MKADLPSDFVDQLRALEGRATEGPWYRLDPPWLASGSETSILAGSPDPHVATFICDFDFFALCDEDEKTSECPDADADLLIYLRNNTCAIADEIAVLRTGIAQLRNVVSIGARFVAACNSAWAAGEPEHKVRTMLDIADEFRAAIDALPASKEPAHG